MVQFRKSQLFSIWLILIIILFFANWVGLRERYVVGNFITNEVNQVAFGDVDISKPGLELVYLNPSGIFIIGGLTSSPWQDLTFQNFLWDTNPLISLTVGDFDINHKGDEIVVLFENGTLFQLSKGEATWVVDVIGALPSKPPVWFTNEMISGQLIASSRAEEIAIVGQYFNWSTSLTSGRVYVANRLENMTWQINQIYVDSHTLLCGSIGDVEQIHEGEEIVTAGQDTGIVFLRFENGTWSSTHAFNWTDTIRSIAIGDFMTVPNGNEIAFVKGMDIFTLYRGSGGWVPKNIWPSQIMKARMYSVLVSDIDPYNPGQEVLGAGTTSGEGRPILVLLSYNTLFWSVSVLWNLIQSPVSVIAFNFDFNRDGSEVIIANSPETAILSVPSIWDRTIRASQMVILPAILLLPTTVILFALADYIGRVSDNRRRARILEMTAKGFVKCPNCHRFVPKDKIKAHRRWHRQQQFR